MHTISAEELLKAYNGKYKYVTMNSRNQVYLFFNKPEKMRVTPGMWWIPDGGNFLLLEDISITEFQGKDWTDCIYKAKPSEEGWIGCLCFFADDESHLGSTAYGGMSVLKRIEESDVRCRYVTKEWVSWKYCRPVRPDEIKFFNDDTSEE